MAGKVPCIDQARSQADGLSVKPPHSAARCSASHLQGPTTVSRTILLVTLLTGFTTSAELFSNPAAAREMSGIEKFFDVAKLEALKAEGGAQEP
jgi:hypothetical protein